MARLAPKKTLWQQVQSRIDYPLVLPVLLLLIIGSVAVYIATSQDSEQQIPIVMVQQLFWILLGILLAFVVMFFNRSFLWRSAPYLYVLGLVLMVLPIFYNDPALTAATGSRNWIAINGVILFQPSEFMKIAYILMMARSILSFQSHEKTDTISEDWRLIGKLALISLPIVILLILQKDFGTALVFAAIASGMIVVSGISWKIVISVIAFVLTLISGFLLLFIVPGGTNLLHTIGVDTYQINRFSAWLDPFKYAQTTTFQQAQGLIAIGSGGLTGGGFNTTNVFVPVRESDMIITVIAENFGFIGCAVLLGMYTALIYRMIRITSLSKNLFYTYITTGFIMMLIFHIFENIGAATGILPLTGIPLPFISQGGSAMVANLIGVGLVLSVSYQNSVQEEKSALSQQQPVARICAINNGG